MHDERGADITDGQPFLFQQRTSRSTILDEIRPLLDQLPTELPLLVGVAVPYTGIDGRVLLIANVLDQGSRIRCFGEQRCSPGVFEFSEMTD